jgi:hypothetical protein
MFFPIDSACGQTGEVGMGPFLLGILLALIPSILLIAWLGWMAGVFQKQPDKAPDRPANGV